MGGITTTLFQRPRDPNFNQTTLLLSGNFPTNGAQNNTFLDSSSNAFSITRNPTTGPNAPTQGTFSPFSQTGWSVYLNGSSSLRDTSTSSVYHITGNFTVEGWYWFDSAAVIGDLFGIEETTAGFAAVQVQITTSRTLTLNMSVTGAAWAVNSTSTATVSLGTWNHVAVTRSGSSINLWLNGVSIVSASNSSALMTTGNFTIIGGRNAAGYITGYVSNFRFVNGTALYTGAFTPSTSPLTTTSQGATETEVELLTCQSNRFVDNSSNGFTLTITGTPSVQAFSPFVPSGAYTTTDVSGSLYFGTTNYLTVAGGSSLAFGSGDFSLEVFVYRTASGSAMKIYDGRPDAAGGNYPVLDITSSNITRFLVDTTVEITGTTVIPANAWTHILVSRVSGNLRLFVNGAQDGSTVSSSTNFINGTGRPAIGVRGSTLSGDPYIGYISNMRVLIGSGFTSVTVPTAPLTAITNTSLLLNFTNAGIFDSTAKNVLETVGNAQISTTPSKFGGSSMYFDGNGDYLQLPSSPVFAMGGGNWTVEMWLYPNSVATLQALLSFGSTAWRFFLNNSGLWFLNSSTSIVQTAQSIVSTGQWYHVAVCKAGSSVRIFLNGTQVGGTGTDNNTYAAAIAYIGSESTGSYLNGYIDDLRITKGVARYTANFNVPTIGFTNR